MISSNPYFLIVKELENKQDYIDSFFKTGMVALVSNDIIAWIEKDKGDFLFYRKISEEQIECLHIDKDKIILLFSFLVDKVHRLNERFSIIEAKPNKHMQFNHLSQKISMYIHHLQLYFQEHNDYKCNNQIHFITQKRQS